MEFFTKLFPIFLVLICTENCRSENHRLRSLRKWLPGLDDWKPSDDLKIDITAYHSGYDYENRTVIVMDLGKWKIPKYMKSKNPEEQLLPKLRTEKLVYSVLDVDLGRNETNSNSGSDYVFVVDGSGLSFQIIRDSRVLQFYIWLLRLLESVIEFAGDVFLVNVNKPLEVILGAVRPLTPKFFSIVTLIGTNRETIISTLRQFIPKDQLPPEYGGSKDFQPIKIF